MSSSAPLSEHRPVFESDAPTLTSDEIEQFARQMLVDEIGPIHMAQIRAAHVVCIGAGGLGSTILLYLTAAGVGRLTIVDFDEVERSNLHRQVIHAEATIGMLKVESAKAACLRLAPGVRVETISSPLSTSNAVSIMEQCDVVVDGTDNVASRYIINDAAMRCHKPLVSGSAMGWDGQLSVYGYLGGPCYRCLFPHPPPPEAVGSCNETGVMGPLPGLIGCLQALEALKVIAGVGEVLSGRMLLFNGLRLTSRVVQLRGRQPSCDACSPAALSSSAPLASLTAQRPEYLATSCAVAVEKLPSGCSCSPAEFAKARLAPAVGSAGHCITIDVRARLQHEMVRLPHSENLPFQTMAQWSRTAALVKNFAAFLTNILAQKELLSSMEKEDEMREDGEEEKMEAAAASLTVFFLCRRGVNSAKAVKLLLEALEKAPPSLSGVPPLCGIILKSVDGGLNAYHKTVEKAFPYY